MGRRGAPPWDGLTLEEDRCSAFGNRHRLRRCWRTRSARNRVPRVHTLRDFRHGACPTTAFPLLALRRDELLSKSPSRVYTRCVILDGGGSFQPPDARNRVPCVHTLRDFRHGRSLLGVLSQLAGRLASLLPESASCVYTRGAISGTAKPDGREMKSRGARATRTRSRGKVPPLIHATLAASLAALLYESFVGAPQLGNLWTSALAQGEAIVGRGMEEPIVRLWISLGAIFPRRALCHGRGLT